MATVPAAYITALLAQIPLPVDTLKRVAPEALPQKPPTVVITGVGGSITQLNYENY